ncbi:hypothetical protein, partial [Chroococcidiopsis sp.]|uniref:hypothetical protein n=1 Tax=Chroococcidiopsis sp. TaxID=3088168 RepID=UPI003F323CB3
PHCLDRPPVIAAQKNGRRLRHQQMQPDLTQSILMSNVPRFIQHIIDRGGVNDDEREWLKSEKLGSLQDILARADEYILYPDTQEMLEQGMFNLVLAIAILSFAPGGINFWGMHFESAPWGIIELSMMTSDGMWKAKTENGVVKQIES